VTVIVAVIVKWMLQWYGYSPGSVKRKRNSSPCARFPESNTPVSEVTVCVICRSSALVQQTVVPGGISTVGGWKLKLLIATTTSVSWHEPDGCCAAEPAETPACGISSAPKQSAAIATPSELRRK
jgi:hypothetical protein